MKFTKILLLPLSIIYGIITGIRNCLFNTGILKSESFSIPVICVGNITVGGTGKTPHTEMIISALKKHFRVACLSRGYKRKTSGFILADNHSTAYDIGDEPMQIKNKFPAITVACDSNRVRGIKKLMALSPGPQAIILDDAFQHRYVKAGINIVLVDYNRPVYKDHLLPIGRLRETTGALRRADYILVTKCPDNIAPIDKRIISKNLKIKPYQKLFFTSMQYGKPRSISLLKEEPVIRKGTSILCITGIAQPGPYIRHLKKYSDNIIELRYPDHHNFSIKDIRYIEESFNRISQKDKCILTTEKDATRLAACQLPKELEKHIFYIPIEPVFLDKDECLINELYEYVRKNKR